MRTNEQIEGGDLLMSFVDFARELPNRGIHESIGELLIGFRRRSDWLERKSTNIFDRDWDVLVVLDACRVDLLDSVADEYDFITGEHSIYSVGGTSPEWIAKTFETVPDSTLRSTGYVTGNPHSSRVDVETDKFGVLDEVWRYAWNSEIGVVPPRAMTDRAIAVGREQDVDRLIVHYMQPHIPFLDAPELTRKMSEGNSEEFGNPDTETVWDRLREGEVKFTTVWEAYRDNLRRVLEDVEILQENMTADRLVITADHGNAMGEYGQYGHGRRERVDSVCRVPWEVTDGTDVGDYTPSVEPRQDESNVDEQLRALGYK